MKGLRLLKAKKSQVLIAVLIAFTIMITLGAAILMQSRSARTSAQLQADTQKAYALAQSGLAIGESYMLDNPAGNLTNEPYNISGGTVTVTADSSKVIAMANYKGAVYYANITLAVVPPSYTPWAKVYSLAGEERLSSVLKTQDEGYLIEAETDVNEGAYKEDILLIKTDGDGDIVWANTYGAAGREMCTILYLAVWPGNNLIVEVSGQGAADGYYFAKSTTSNNWSNPGDQWDMLLFKIDKNTGAVVWAKTYGFGSATEYCHDLRDDGTGLILAGESDGAFFVLKVDYTGAKVWAYEYDYAGEQDTIQAVVPFEELGNPRYLLAGNTWQGKDKKDKTANIVALKIDSAGSLLAKKVFYTDVNDFVVAAKESNNAGVLDGFIFTGWCVSSAREGLVLKTDTSLVPTWYKLHYLDNFHYRDILQDSDGNYYIAGLRGLAAYGGDFEGSFLKLDSTGTFQSQKQYGDKVGSGSLEDDDELYAIDIFNEGFVLGGITMQLGGGGTNKDILVVSTDTSGDVPGNSIVTNDQSIGYSARVLDSQDTDAYAPLVRTDVTSTVTENPIALGNIIVLDYPANLTITTIDLP